MDRLVPHATQLPNGSLKQSAGLTFPAAFNRYRTTLQNEISGMNPSASLATDIRKTA